MSKRKHGFWWWVLIGWWWWPCRALVYDIPRLIIRGIKSQNSKMDKHPQKRGALKITHKDASVEKDSVQVVRETAPAMEAESVTVETPVVQEPVQVVTAPLTKDTDPVVEKPMAAEPVPTEVTPVEKPDPAETPVIVAEPVPAEILAVEAEPIMTKSDPVEIQAVEEPAPAENLAVETEPTLAAPATKAPKPAPKKVKTYKVAGVSYRLKNIMELASENDEYSYSKKELIESELTGQRIWKYDFCANKVGLVPEPDNPQDPNAIKVIIDGLHVGYIKAGSCAHLLKVLSEERLGKIEAIVGGGPYKYVGCVDYTEDGDEVYGNLERDDVPYYVRLEVEEK